MEMTFQKIMLGELLGKNTIYDENLSYHLDPLPTKKINQNFMIGENTIPFYLTDNTILSSVDALVDLSIIQPIPEIQLNDNRSPE